MVGESAAGTNQNRDDGGPAFPTLTSTSVGSISKAESIPGMTLRDYLAAAALTGLIAQMSDASVHNAWAQGKSAEEFWGVTGAAAYYAADAMLAARNQAPPAAANGGAP